MTSSHHSHQPTTALKGMANYSRDPVRASHKGDQCQPERGASFWKRAGRTVLVMLWELGFRIGSSESPSDWRGTGFPFRRALPGSGGREGPMLSIGPGTSSQEAAKDPGGLGTTSKLASDAYQQDFVQDPG